VGPLKCRHADYIACETKRGEPAGRCVATQQHKNRGQAEGHHPACHDSVETQNQAGDNKPDNAGRAAKGPLGTAVGYPFQGGDGIGVSVAAYDQFRHQRRVGKSEGNKQVDQQKCSTAVAGGLCGKTPDVTQAYCAAGGGHYKTEP